MLFSGHLCAAAVPVRGRLGLRSATLCRRGDNHHRHGQGVLPLALGTVQVAAPQVTGIPAGQECDFRVAAQIPPQAGERLASEALQLHVDTGRLERLAVRIQQDSTRALGLESQHREFMLHARARIDDIIHHFG